MAPTHVQEEIEGRYKEYAYSPVPTSCTSTVYYSPTLGKYPIKFGGSLPKYRTIGDQCPAAEMTEKGSTLLQYLAAAAGKFQPFFSMAKRGRSIRVPGLSRGVASIDDAVRRPEFSDPGAARRWPPFPLASVSFSHDAPLFERSWNSRSKIDGFRWNAKVRNRRGRRAWKSFTDKQLDDYL